MKMKNLIIPALLVALIAGCNAPAKNGGGTLAVQVDGAADQMLYFNQFVNGRPVPLDSIRLNNDGEGTFNLPELALDFYSLSLGNDQSMSLILDGGEQATVKATASAFHSPTSITGSKDSELLHDFFKNATEFDARNEELTLRLTNNPGDSAALEEYTALNQAYQEQNERFIHEHMNSPAVMAALYRVNIQEELPLFEQVIDSLEKVMPHSQQFTSFRDQVTRLAEQVKYQQQIEAMQAEKDKLIAIGSEAPDFTQDTPEGTPLSLSSLRGKVVLIDFWASWCKPCRIENPNVVRVYNKYHDKGFEILGVSLDRTKEAWVAAIKQDGLPWKHVSDLKFWNNAVAEQYGITSIPHTILLDREGKVLAKNLRGKQLENKLDEVFN